LLRRINVRVGSKSGHDIAQTRCLNCSPKAAIG
jgi:hypothetical protein